VSLERFADDVFIATTRGKFLGLESGSRMTVVRMSDGGLFVHSPVRLDGALQSAVDALGPVRAVVAPSIFHHLYVAEWMRAYPNAIYGACPGLEWKRPDLAFTEVLADEPNSAWERDLAQVYFSARRENEVVFFHHKSRTMICCDALLNLSKHDYLSTRMLARFMGNSAPGLGWMERFMVRDRALGRRQVERILAWDIDKIVLSHGDPVLHDGREVVRRAYAWV